MIAIQGLHYDAMITIQGLHYDAMIAIQDYITMLWLLAEAALTNVSLFADKTFNHACEIMWYLNNTSQPNDSKICH